MKRYRQFQPVLISDFEVSRWHHPVHNHNHYELIYIKKGMGDHHINNELIPYKAGDVFLLGPGEEHYFEIGASTHFVFLKFTELYMHGKSSDDRYGYQQLEYLIKSREARLSRFILNPDDRETVGQLFDVIISLKKDLLRNEELIRLQILALSAILKRNLPETILSEGKNREMEAIFNYLHVNIYTPAKLRSAVMAREFKTPAGYFGPYFKRNAGMTLRDYIRTYRKTLIQKRMTTGKYSLKQIAEEFGLTDESHVYKLLK